MRWATGKKLLRNVLSGFLFLAMCALPKGGHANAFEETFLDWVNEELSPVNPQTTPECDPQSPTFLGICAVSDPDNCVEEKVRKFCEAQSSWAITAYVCFGVETYNEFGSDEPGLTSVDYYRQLKFCSSQAAEAYKDGLSSILDVIDF